MSKNIKTAVPFLYSRLIQILIPLEFSRAEGF